MIKFFLDVSIILSKQSTQYLRLLLCDENEAVVVNEITVNVLLEE